MEQVLVIACEVIAQGSKRSNQDLSVACTLAMTCVELGAIKGINNPAIIDCIIDVYNVCEDVFHQSIHRLLYSICESALDNDYLAGIIRNSGLLQFIQNFWEEDKVVFVKLFTRYIRAVKDPNLLFDPIGVSLLELLVDGNVKEQQLGAYFYLAIAEVATDMETAIEVYVQNEIIRRSLEIFFETYPEEFSEVVEEVNDFIYRVYQAIGPSIIEDSFFEGIFDDDFLLEMSNAADTKICFKQQLLDLAETIQSVVDEI